MDRYGSWDDWDQAHLDIAEMKFPAQCSHCRGVYDLAKVIVTSRYTDCSMWKSPCCNLLVDDRKPPWGREHYVEIRRA